jgi:hypothetical protein
MPLCSDASNDFFLPPSSAPTIIEEIVGEDGTVGHHLLRCNPSNIKLLPPPPPPLLLLVQEIHGCVKTQHPSLVEDSLTPAAVVLLLLIMKLLPPADYVLLLARRPTPSWQTYLPDVPWRWIYFLPMMPIWVCMNSSIPRSVEQQLLLRNLWDLNSMGKKQRRRRRRREMKVEIWRLVPPL